MANYHCFRSLHVLLVLFVVFLEASALMKYVQVFRDDFNGNSIDRRKWNLASTSSNGVNDELQYYHPRENYVSNGRLYIRSQRSRWAGLQYTSGRVDTRGKFKMLYGEVEWRVQLPRGRGIWPALWLVPVACQAGQLCASSWPPEIDVMEACGQNTRNITTTVHYGPPWPGNQRDSLATTPGADFASGFHTFKVLWDPNQVVFSIDGKVVHSVTDKSRIPNKEMYLIMNVAVGGNFCQSPDSSTRFPTQFVIDYVSVHRWQD